MFRTVRNIFVVTLLIGLILAEVFVNADRFTPTPASSQRQLTSEEQQTILSILNGNSDPASIDSFGMSTDAWKIDIPNPADILRDAQYASGLVYRPFGSTITPPTLDTTTGYSSTPTTPEDILASVLPPAGTPLYIAYQEGGRAWYYEGTNVLVISPDETIRSFNKDTGLNTIWLQKELAYPPIEDINAIVTYRSNYNAEVVAQTSQWVLMKFPSGGFIKVAKPSYQPPATLPTILPGYEQSPANSY